MARRLGMLATCTRMDAAALFDGDGAVTDRPGFAELTTLPTGVARVRIFEDVKTGSKVEYIEIKLEEPGPSCAELEAELGAGSVVHRFSPGEPYTLGFAVDVEGAPFRATVFAIFLEKPTAATRAARVELRRDLRL